MSAERLPQRFESVAALEDFMTEPTPVLVGDLVSVPGDIMILGAAGKMGPTLARMAKRAAPGKRVVGVARFSDPAAKAALDAAGVETIACDLLDRGAVARLPMFDNIVYMAAMKFGATGTNGYTHPVEKATMRALGKVSATIAGTCTFMAQVSAGLPEAPNFMAAM